MRPRTLDEFTGQEALLGPGKPLRTQIERDEIGSMILWGPPGCGKTTLARLIARMTHSEFVAFSAVLTGIKEIKDVMAAAEHARRAGRRTIVFIDEVHRFNKAQQDAFLPHVEAGNIILIGATTENPSFEVIAPLLSRTRVYVLQALSTEQIEALLRRALADQERGLGNEKIAISDEAIQHIAVFSGGDARAAYNTLEAGVRAVQPDASGTRTITKELLAELLQRKFLLYDKSGEEHYNLISALHKSVRNSDPDASLYWLVRMLESGRRPAVHRAAAGAHGERGHRPRRTGRAGGDDCGHAGRRFCRAAGGKSRAGAGRRVSFARAEIERALYRVWLRDERFGEHARRACSAAPAQCSDRPDEKYRLREGISVRARCGRKSGRHGHACRNRLPEKLTTIRPTRDLKRACGSAWRRFGASKISGKQYMSIRRRTGFSLSPA